MLRTHNCNSLNIDNVGEIVTLCGWVQKTRDLGGMTFVDLRDRYGITQLAFDIKKNKLSCLEARSLNREFVVQVKGLVIIPIVIPVALQGRIIQCLRRCYHVDCKSLSSALHYSEHKPQESSSRQVQH